MQKHAGFSEFLTAFKDVIVQEGELKLTIK